MDALLTILELAFIYVGCTYVVFRPIIEESELISKENEK